MELEGQVLVIKRIRVRYNLSAPGADPEKVARVHSIHQQGCPLHRSIEKAIEITTEMA